MARPKTWFKKVTAPPEAMAFYEMIAMLQDSGAFRECHPCEGAVDHAGVPVIKWQGRVHALPYVISSVMGIEYGKRKCSTRNCINPFHYAVPDRVGGEPLIPTIPQGDQWNSLVDFYVEDKGLELSYPVLRAAIPREDIDDENLQAAIRNYKRS